MRRALIIAALLLGAGAVAYQGWDMVAESHGRPMLQGNDDSHYYFWLRSAVVDGDWDFANDLRDAPTISPEAKRALQALPRTATGRQPNKYPVGWAVVSAPFFLPAHALSLLGAGPADGWQPIYFVCLWAGHLALTVVGLLLAQQILRRFMPPGPAWVGVLAVWLASPLLYYQTARISMVHGPAFVLTVAVTELALRLQGGSRRHREWALLGLCAALLAISRPTSVVYLLHPACLVGVVIWRGLQERTGRPALVGRVAHAAVWAGMVLGIQLLAWRRVYGSWYVDAYAGESFTFGAPHLWSVLCSSRHGWFYWHPLLLPAVMAFSWASVRGTLPRSWLVSLAAIVYVNSAWWCWWFGSSFGNRAFEGATLYCMAGLGLLWAGLAGNPGARRAATLAIVIAVGANAVLLALFMTGKISREEGVAYDVFLRAVAGCLHQ
jgi:hypothetical protein